jgi:glutathione synthase/RimK-type ligase-like ATP-grasp enzyme
MNREALLRNTNAQIFYNTEEQTTKRFYDPGHAPCTLNPAPLMMPQTPPLAALLTDHRYTASKAPEGDWYLANILKDDELLQKALTARGIDSVRVDWADKSVNWRKFDCIVFRTTWDYFERFEEFTAWLKQAEKVTRVINDPSLVWWNMDKHYLHDLHQKGIPVVPSAFIEKGSSLNLREMLDESGWSEAVIKPCVSGAARHTYRVNRENAGEIQTTVEALLKEEAFLLQPFMDEVVRTGEDTLMVIGGKFTHAVRKRAKQGDFRVQDDHGGTVHEYTPTQDQIRLAEQAMAACSPEPLYGRVDMVRDNNGSWQVMELELIEPELWLRYHPPAAEAFAEVLVKQLR